MNYTTTHSLKNRFKRLSIRWSLFGLLLTALTVVPIVFVVVKHSSERQVEVMATALSSAFRPIILQDNIRDAQTQMRSVAKLKQDESVTVFDTNWKPVFKGIMGSPESIPHCTKSVQPCWLAGNGLVSIALPIYFDEQNSEQYGYLVLNLKPTIDWFQIFIIVFCASLIFFLQTRTIYISLKNELKGIEAVLLGWKKRIESPIQEKIEKEESRLFSEFLPLEESIKKLHNEIEKLKDDAASKAKIDVVRGIGHDLKTPLSQVSKFFAVLVENTERSGKVDEGEVNRIEGVLSRMGALIRQVTSLGHVREAPIKINLSRWIEAYCRELKLDFDSSQKRIALTHQTGCDAFISIGETDLFRIVDNLVRNAVESLPQQGNHVVTVAVRTENGVKLQISDTGSGIPKEIQSRIFDLDFTTKKTRGTGLGLGIVKKICSESGLTIGFSTKEGCGTTFDVGFPARVEFLESEPKGKTAI